MRLLNTAREKLDAFLRRAEYEIAYTHPQPSVCSGQTGPQGYVKWGWPARDLVLEVKLSSKIVKLWHPIFHTGVLRIQPARNSVEVRQLFYAMFDMLGNHDQTFRIITEPYKGP